MDSRTGLLAVALLTATVSAHEIERVSSKADGSESQGYSPGPVAITPDGRWVAFVSRATDLDPNKTSLFLDVFVKDRVTGAVVLISAATDGSGGDFDSDEPSISDDGQFVAFSSYAEDLIPSDLNRLRDVFVRDRDPDGNGVFDEGNAVTELVSVRLSGKQGKKDSFDPSISGDGRFVTFATPAANLSDNDTNSMWDVLLKDRSTGDLIRISDDVTGATSGNGMSYAPEISRDGRYVAFHSYANDLIASDTNAHSDIFVRDVQAAITVRISLDASRGEADADSLEPSISRTGRFVAFHSPAGDLVSGDTNQEHDVFVCDRDPDGDGSFDDGNDLTTIVSVDSSGVLGNDGSFLPEIAPDGSRVAYTTIATNLFPGDTNGWQDVYVHDLATAATTPVSWNCAQAFANHGSWSPSVTEDGQLVAFASGADNLITGDTNVNWDVFLNDASVADVDASWSNYGSGFAGTNGIPSLVSNADPEFGSSIVLHADNSYGPWTPGIALAGLDDASIVMNSGATLLVDVLLLVPMPIPPWGTDLPFSVLRDPSWCGLEIFVQIIQLDPGAVGNLSFTPGLQLVIGV